MKASTNVALPRVTAKPRTRRWRRTLRSLLLHPGAFIGSLCIILLVVGALFAPRLAPYDWNDTNVGTRLSSPSAEHWFGTDLHGRDVFSRVLYGGRFSIAVGLATVTFSMILGSLFGVSVAYFGGRVDDFGGDGY